MATAKQPDLLEITVGVGVSWGHQWAFAETADGPLDNLVVYNAVEFRMASDGPDTPDGEWVWSRAGGQITLESSEPDSGVLDTVTLFLADTGVVAPALQVGLYRWWLMLGEEPDDANEVVLVGRAKVSLAPGEF